MLDAADPSSFVVRPRFKVALIQIVFLEAFIVLGFAFVLGMRAVCARWLSRQFPPESTSGLALVFSTPLLMLIPYLGSRTRSWIVSSGGIDTLRNGERHRTITWSEVVAVEVWPGVGAAIKHGGSRGIGEQLACLTLQDTRKLSEMWRQVRPPAHPPSRSGEIPLAHLVRITLACGLVALLCIPLFLVFRDIALVRAVCGMAGKMGAIFGTCIGFWAACRVRSLRLLISTVPAALALLGWMWIMVQCLHRLAR